MTPEQIAKIREALEKIDGLSATPYALKCRDEALAILDDVSTKQGNIDTYRGHVESVNVSDEEIEQMAFDWNKQGRRNGFEGFIAGFKACMERMNAPTKGREVLAKHPDNAGGEK